MSNEEGLTPAQRELELALSSVRPARGGLNRDRVLFRAGQASARRQGMRMAGAMGVLSGLLATVAVMLALDTPQTRVLEHIVYREAPAPTHLASHEAVESLPQAALSPLPSPGAQAEYLRLRQAVLERGLDELPAAPASAARDDLKDLLDSVARPARAPKAAGGLYPKWFINGDRS